ncbi:PstS family phosphate ABC transporter substrate-binding protein [Mastigocladopsis repens]|uniref:PstS family phosphate ABC transporter substrate-binding protein n=1 Tax=Mastigocladopsis repens TaxID=221287 RepID=UPI0002EEBBB5|nr:substrate-binding domain-containing protein [Mastigocladopsis repens]
MNTNESNTKGSIICGRCTYDANPRGATHCHKCGKPLVVTSVPTSDMIARSDSVLVVGGVSLLAMVLLLFGVGGYFFWRQIQSPTISSTQNISSENSPPDIAFYDSMKKVPNVPEGRFPYGGATTFASLTAHGTHKAINQAYPNFHLRYTEPNNNKPGSTEGIAMLLDGELSFAQSTQPLKDAEYSKARERGFTLEQVPIGIDAVGCYVHPDISIPGLSVNQLQDIYKGKITNWKNVGGPDLPILPFKRNAQSSGLIKTLLGSEAGSVSPNVQSSRDYTELFRKVASTPGAIGIGTATLIGTQQRIRPVALAPDNSKNYVPLVIEGNRLNRAAFLDGTYPLTRRIFVIIRRNNTPDEQAGVAYSNLLLSKEGQEFVEKAGFIPIR